MVYCIRHAGILQGIVVHVRASTVTVITAGYLFANVSRSLRPTYWLYARKPRKVMYR
jgi:hypothetical protein